MMIEASDDVFIHDLVKPRNVRDCLGPAARSYCHENDVIVAVSIGVVALPEGSAVLFRGQVFGVQPMCCTEPISSRDARLSHDGLRRSFGKTKKPGSPFILGDPGFALSQDFPQSSSSSYAYALKELPHPQVVFATGFLIEKPDPCKLST